MDSNGDMVGTNSKRSTMKVLHVFDQWLNQTMNWAHGLLSHCDAEHYIIADTFVNHNFDERGFKILENRIQKKIGKGKDEWSMGPLHKVYKKWGKQYHNQHILLQSKEIGAQLIHFHFATVAAKYLKAIESTNIPVVVSFYGYDYEMAPHRNPEILQKYHRLFRTVSRILTEGPHGKNTLIKMGCPPEKVEVVPLGIDTNFELRLKKKNPVLKLVQPATFTPKKGQDVTIEAVRLAQQEVEVSITFFGESGDDQFFRDIQNQLSQLDPNHHRISPFVDLEKFEEELLHYDAIIQPSKYAPNMDCEGGAPVTLLHAQALGLPVLSTTHCDIPFVVQDRKTGWLCPENDALCLSKKIIDLARMSDYDYQVMAQNAHEWASARFNLHSCGAFLKEVYSQITADSPS